MKVGLLVLALPALAATAPRRLLIGVMSMVKDVPRREAMRETWVKDAKTVAPTLRVRFVLGRPADAREAEVVKAENASHGDLVVLPCDENQHNGKTLHWFWHASDFLVRSDDDAPLVPSAEDAERFDFVVKMDQDAYV